MKKRTALNSKKEYEDRWTEAFLKIEAEIIQNKKSLIEAIEKYQTDEIRKSSVNNFSFNLHKKLGLVSNRDQTPHQRLVVMNGNYEISSINTTFNSEFIEVLFKIIKESKEQIDYIVELGSGIGRHIYTLADKLIPYQKQNKIEYFSCEYTNSGQEACRKLLKYSNEKNIHVEYFDYTNPNLEFLPKGKNYLFFTFHSIEQIPELKRDFIDEILNLTNNCICLHAEPVGWQYNNNLIKYSKENPAGSWEKNQSIIYKKLFKINQRLYNKYGLSFMKNIHRYGIELDKDDINKPDKVSINAAKQSSERDYNKNLIHLLKTLEADGLIKIDSEMINIYGKKPFNPTTIITWHKLNN